MYTLFGFNDNQYLRILNEINFSKIFIQCALRLCSRKAKSTYSKKKNENLTSYLMYALFGFEVNRNSQTRSVW